MNATWSADPVRNFVSAVTTTWTGKEQATVFVTVNHRSAECVGLHAAHRAARFKALEPIRQGVRRCFGTFA